METKLLQKLSDARATRRALRRAPCSSQLLHLGAFPVDGWSALPDELVAAPTEFGLILYTQ
jgi:hypothetical protein